MKNKVSWNQATGKYENYTISTSGNMVTDQKGKSIHPGEAPLDVEKTARKMREENRNKMFGRPKKST